MNCCAGAARNKAEEGLTFRPSSTFVCFGRAGYLCSCCSVLRSRLLS